MKKALVALIVLGVLGVGGLLIWQGLRPVAPGERIAKIEAIQKVYSDLPDNMDQRFLGTTIPVSGYVVTSDGGALPKDLICNLYSQGSSSEISSDGRFSGNVPYGAVYIQVWGSDYAMSFAGPLEPKGKEGIKDFKIVLEKGFTAKIRVMDEQGNPVRGAKLEGGYEVRAGGWNYDFRKETDEQGEVQFQETGKARLHLNLKAPGYQNDEVAIEFNDKKEYVWRVRRAQLVKGMVVEEKTGTPIEGAQIRMLAEGERVYSPDSDPVAISFSKGVFGLATLKDRENYVFLISAKRFGKKVLRNISTDRKDLGKVALGPEWKVFVRVLAPVGKKGEYLGPKEITYEKEFRYASNGYSAASRNVPLTIKEGVGCFETTDVWPGKIKVSALGKEAEIDVEQGQREVVLDLRKVNPNIQVKPRMVELVLDVPAGSPEVKGGLNVQFYPQPGRPSLYRDYPIEKGKVRLEVEAPGRLVYRPKEVVGYWIEGNNDIQVPAGEGVFVVKVPVSPGGAIYGKLDQRALADKEGASVSVIVVELPKNMEMRMFYNNSVTYYNLTTETYSFPALPLGGTYAIRAKKGNAMVISDAVTLSESHPTRKVDLAFVKGEDLEGKVVFPDGKPSGRMDLNISYDSKDYGSFGWSMKTNSDGTFMCRNLNTDLPGEYSVMVVTARDYLPVMVKVRPGKEPVTIRLEKGNVLTGVFLDEKTGKPFSGVPLQAFRMDGVSRQAWNVQAEEETNERGEFRFSTMAEAKYQIMVGMYGYKVDQNVIVEVKKGENKPVTIKGKRI